MSWLFSRALVEEFLAGSSSGGELFAQLSVIPTPLLFCSQDKTTELSRLSRFGMTYAPLTESHGEALLTWYQGVSRARALAQQEKEPASKMDEVGSGRKWLGLLAKFDPVASLWKTPQSSLLEGSDAYSQTWPAWGSMRNGECWARTMPELRTCATEYGLWPTPCATDSSDRKVDSGALHETKRGTFKHRGKNGTLSQIRLSQVVKHRTPNGVGRMTPEWCEWLMGWPTGHTGLKPLEMDKFQEWQLQHGKSLEGQ